MKIIGLAQPQKFQITSGQMLVTDPCYDKNEDDLKYQAKLQAKNGTWFATAEYSDEGEWGTRVSRIIAWHESQKLGADTFMLPVYDSEIGVDSGQAGFFDFEKYPAFPRDEQNEDTFYEKVCDLTLSGVPYSVLEKVGYAPSHQNNLTEELKTLRESSNFDDIQEYEIKRYMDGPQFNRKKLPDVLNEFNSLGKFGTIDFGAVSSSGYGDGGYSLYVNTESSGDVTAVCISFLEEEDESNPEDECYSDD